MQQKYVRNLKILKNSSDLSLNTMPVVMILYDYDYMSSNSCNLYLVDKIVGIILTLRKQNPLLSVWKNHWHNLTTSLGNKNLAWLLTPAIVVLLIQTSNISLPEGRISTECVSAIDGDRLVISQSDTPSSHVVETHSVHWGHSLVVRPTHGQFTVFFLEVSKRIINMYLWSLLYVSLGIALGRNRGGSKWTVPFKIISIFNSFPKPLNNWAVPKDMCAITYPFIFPPTQYSWGFFDI